MAWIYLIPVMLVEYILALGITFISAGITVYFRDLQHILGIVAMAWMYLTPIMYPESMVPVEYRSMFNLNPMLPVLRAYRDILYYAKIPEMQTLLHAFLFGVVILIVGVLMFSRLKRRFAEEL
jgi:ABC-2 type transport system permease protein